jgi:hypothetical protein
MIAEFTSVKQGVLNLIEEWEPRLMGLTTGVITERRNSQNRTVKQILGHLVDSVSNNTHRIIHLQYREDPMEFPNYASNGNNDRWIAIQNFQDEDWYDLIRLWKFYNLHFVHVISHIDPAKLENRWIASPAKMITLKEMVNSYLDHLELHLSEIEELIG